jgi:hypothetical protein
LQKYVADAKSNDLSCYAFQQNLLCKVEKSLHFDTQQLLTLSCIVILGNTLTQDNNTRKQTTRLLTDLTTGIYTVTASHNTDTRSTSYKAAY